MKPEPLAAAVASIIGVGGLVLIATLPSVMFNRPVAIAACLVQIPILSIGVYRAFRIQKPRCKTRTPVDENSQ